MIEEDGIDVPMRLSPWDVFAAFSNLVLDILVSVTKFMSVITHMIINHADVVDAQKEFHDDVARTIETIIEGE